MIVFKYRREHSGIIRPVADVIVMTEKGTTGILMYIDSGADITMIPRSAGEALGFDERDSGIQELKGIAGEGVPYIVKQVALTLGGSETVQAPIAWALIEEVPPLLGRNGVFNCFRIVFDEAEERVEFHRK